MDLGAQREPISAAAKDGGVRELVGGGDGRRGIGRRQHASEEAERGVGEAGAGVGRDGGGPGRDVPARHFVEQHAGVGGAADAAAAELGVEGEEAVAEEEVAGEAELDDGAVGGGSAAEGGRGGGGGEEAEARVVGDELGIMAWGRVVEVSMVSRVWRVG